jgi:GH18 family chitinase
MRITLLFTWLLFAATVFAAPAPKKPVVIGYVGGFHGLLDVTQIKAKQLTHINYAFVNVINHRAVLSNLATDTVNFRNLNTLKQQNPDLKIIISIGGWAWSANFSDAVLTDTARAAFAASAIDIVRQYDLDGVDIDWEYPALPGEEGNIYRPEDTKNYTLLFRDLRAGLDKLQKETHKHQYLTTAVGASASFVSHTEMGKAAKYLDYINLMTYDYGMHKIAGHHTNLYDYSTNPGANSGDKTVKNFAAAGVPMSKMVMGIAFYGRRFQLVDSATKGVGDSIVSQSSGRGYTYLKDSVMNQQGFTAFRDEKAGAPYLFNATTKQYITYDDEWSVSAKCNYVKQHKMAGVMFWEYGSDPKEYLLNEISKDL